MALGGFLLNTNLRHNTKQKLWIKNHPTFTLQAFKFSPFPFLDFINLCIAHFIFDYVVMEKRGGVDIFIYFVNFTSQ